MIAMVSVLLMLTGGLCAALMAAVRRP